MNRYIDADKIVITAERGISADGLIFIPMIDVHRSIDATPTADVVEVTRCKDCFYAEEMEGIVGGTCLYCTHWCKDVDGDTFCSNGFSTTNKESKQ